MRKIFITAFAVIITFALSTQAQALISDLPDADGFGYFLDESTGYTWMDVDNFLNMTYNEVLSAIDGTGFQIATYDQVLALQVSAPAYIDTFYADYAIMGGAPWGNDIIWGMYEDGDDDPNASWTWKYNNTNSGTWYYNGTPGGNEVIRDSTRYEAMGAFVVLTDDTPPVVPEPMTMSLLGMGLMGCGLLRKKKK